MSKYITILASALVFQFIIIVFLFSSDPKIDIENKARSLINLDLNELSTIKIVEGEKKLLLTKKQNKWQLEDYPALKLQSSKVKLLTNDLGLMKVTWPVTSTSSSHERFKVMNKNFEKLN